MQAGRIWWPLRVFGERWLGSDVVTAVQRLVLVLRFARNIDCSDSDSGWCQKVLSVLWSWNEVYYPVVEQNLMPIIPRPFSIIFLDDI